MQLNKTRADGAFKPAALKTFFYWVHEREKVRQAKEAGKPKPWSKDPLLQNYRWCNVRRMDDKVSRWLLDNWYDDKQDSRTLLIAATLARLINWPDSLVEIMSGHGYFRAAQWDPDLIEAELEHRKAIGHKVFTGAYIINGARGGSKIKQVVENVQDVAERAVIDPDSMERTWASLVKCKGIGSFIAGQIVADLRHTSAMRVSRTYGDAMTWAPLGPGSARGMRRLLGLDPQGPMKQTEFNVLLPLLITEFQNRAPGVWADRKLEAMDVQNCLCESDKYNRLLAGGHVRSGYPGAAESGVLL